MSRASQEIGISHIQSRFDPGMVRKSWKLKASIQKDVDTALAVLNSYEKPTIAFHVRGGDKSMEDQILGRKTTKPEDLINTFLDNFVGVRGGTCVMIGDDQTVIAEAERLARVHIGCHVVRPSKNYLSKGHNQATFNALALHERCRETKQLIKDLEMMARADYFVTFADVSYDDMGTRIRRYFGIGGFKNVTLGKDTSKKLHSRRTMLTTPL